MSPSPNNAHYRRFLAALRYFCKARKPLCFEDQEELSALLCDAAVHGNARFVVAAIRAGAGVHADEDQALFCAVEQDNPAALRALLEHGADPSARDGRALWDSANCRPECLDLLLAADAQPGAHMGWDELVAQVDRIDPRPRFRLRSFAIFMRHRIFVPQPWREEVLADLTARGDKAALAECLAQVL